MFDCLKGRLEPVPQFLDFLNPYRSVHWLPNDRRATLADLSLTTTLQRATYEDPNSRSLNEGSGKE